MLLTGWLDSGKQLLALFPTEQQDFSSIPGSARLALKCLVFYAMYFLSLWIQWSAAALVSTPVRHRKMSSLLTGSQQSWCRSKCYQAVRTNVFLDTSVKPATELSQQFIVRLAFWFLQSNVCVTSLGVLSEERYQQEITWRNARLETVFGTVSRSQPVLFRTKEHCDLAHRWHACRGYKSGACLKELQKLLILLHAVLSWGWWKGWDLLRQLETCESGTLLWDYQPVSSVLPWLPYLLFLQAKKKKKKWHEWP